MKAQCTVDTINWNIFILMTICSIDICMKKCILQYRYQKEILQYNSLFQTRVWIYENFNDIAGNIIVWG